MLISSFAFANNSNETKTLTIENVNVLKAQLESKGVLMSNITIENNVVCGFSIHLENSIASYDGYTDCTGWTSDILWDYIHNLLAAL